jgi:hypothetical protein
VSICNRTAAGQPDVESLSSLGPEIPLLWWISKREIRLGGGIRSGRTGVDAVETVTKRVKMVEKTIRRTSSGTTLEYPI